MKKRGELLSVVLWRGVKGRNKLCPDGRTLNFVSPLKNHRLQELEKRSCNLASQFTKQETEA
jgi:hypothetical protein